VVHRFVVPKRNGCIKLKHFPIIYLTSNLYFSLWFSFSCYIESRVSFHLNNDSLCSCERRFITGVKQENYRVWIFGFRKHNHNIHVSWYIVSWRKEFVVYICCTALNNSLFLGLREWSSMYNLFLGRSHMDCWELTTVSTNTDVAIFRINNS
jgi:hypothetical protein